MRRASRSERPRFAQQLDMAAMRGGNTVASESGAERGKTRGAERLAPKETAV